MLWLLHHGGSSISLHMGAPRVHVSIFSVPRYQFSLTEHKVMSSVLQCRQTLSCSPDSSTKFPTAAFSPFWVFGMWGHQREKHVFSGATFPKMLLLTSSCLSRHFTYPGREESVS